MNTGNNINLDNNTAQNINGVLDGSDVKSKIGDNVQAYNTPVLQEVREVNTGPTVVVQKVRNKATPLFLIIIFLLFGACYYMYDKSNKTISYYENEYSPINTSKEVTLNNDSFLVKSLYNTVKTDIKEDTVMPYYDNSFKLYIAYRNISHSDIYESNCNMFNNSSMQSFNCKADDKDYVPTAFKITTMQDSINKIFGESANVTLDNLQYGNTCFGGYQYIPDRGEFVSGKCIAQSTILLQASKELTKATSTKDKIVLEEKVKYSNPTGGEIPAELKSGIYHYTFRLDKNYNYILENKELVEERG